MKTPCNDPSSSRPGSLLTTGPILARPGRRSFWCAASWRLTLALIMVSGAGLHADPSVTALHISRPVVDVEGLTTFQLSWNASSNATYRVQSATDLRAAAAWKTVEVVTPTGSVGQASIRITPRDAFDNPPPATFFRIILPQPQIFSVEPAIVAPGGPVDFYVLGQCFPTNAELRINSLPQSGTLYQSSCTLVQPSFVPDVAGDYQVSLVISGQVVSSFTVVCADALTSPELVLQGPPNMEPPASPSARSKQSEAKSNSKAMFTAQRTVGGGEPLDPDSDGDGLSATTQAGTRVRKGMQDIKNLAAFEVAEVKKGLNAVNVKLARNIGSSVQDGVAIPKFINITAEAKKAAAKADIGAIRAGILYSVSVGGDDCDDGDPLASLLMPALMKAKEKANRTKCANNLRIIGVQPFSGEVQECVVDFAIPGRELDFVWARTYHSRLGRTGTATNGWTFSYDVSCVQNSSGGIDVYDGTGRKDTFTLGTNGTYSCPELFREGAISNNTFTLTFADTGRWVFHPFDSSPTAGLVHQVITRNGSVITLTHNAASGRLEQIVDDLGRTNTVAYDTSDRLASVTDFSGRTVRYEYDGNGDLVACVSPPVVGTPNGNDFPGGKTNRYTYTSGYPLALDRQNHLLLSCVDALGQTNVQFTYDLSASSPSYLRCTASQCGANPPTVCSYGHQIHLPQYPGTSLTDCIVNDPLGNVTESYFDARGRCVAEREYTGRATPGLPVTDTVNRPKNKLRQTDPDYYETRAEWNNDSLCTAETSPSGQRVECVYECDFDPATPARKRADCRVVREIASSPVDSDGDGSADLTERVSRYDYHPGFGSDATVSRVMRLMDIARERSGDPYGLGAAKVRDYCVQYRESDFEFARGPRQTTSVDGSYGHAANLKFRARFPLVNNSLYVTAMTNPRGNVTTGDYDAQGNAVARKQITINLRRADFTYNSNGQLTAVTNAPDGNGLRRVDTFSYYTNGPQAGYLESCVVNAGAGGLALTSSFEYDVRGNLTRCVDPGTNDWLFAYNALDQCVRAQSPVNISARCATDFAYDANDNLVSCTTEVRDADDNLVGTKINRASYNKLVREIEYARFVSSSQVITNRYVFDANGQCVQALGPDAVSGADPHQTVTFQYDERGLLFREISAPGSPLQCTTQCDYDANGNVTRLSDGLEGTPSITTMEYDGFGGGGVTQMRKMRSKKRPILPDPKFSASAVVSKITDPMGNVTTFHYDANDNLKVARHFGETNDVPGSAGNLRLAETRCDYDGLDRIYKVHALHFGRTQSPIGDGEATTTFAYAPNGACTSVTDDLGHVTAYTYDTVGWLAAVNSSSNFDTIYVRNRLSKVISYTQTDMPSLGGQPQVFSCTYAYDSLNRLVSTTDGAGNISSCAYDSLGRVVRTTDALGNDTTYDCDFMDKLRAVLHYAGSSSAQPATVVRSSSATYDTSSRCLTSTDANDNPTSYAYDSMGRCTSVTRPDGTQEQLVWSPRSNLTQTTDPNGTVCVNTYDLNDRVIQRSISTGGGGGGGAVYVETFAFDGCDRLVGHHDDDCDGDFAYDSLGSCVRETLNGLATTSTYDALGNRLSLTYPGGRVLTYTYDTSSRCTGITESGQSLASFDYTGLDRVTRITYGNGTRTLIGYNGLVSPPNAQGDYGFGQISRIQHAMVVNSSVFSDCKFGWNQKENKGARTVAIPGAGGRTNDMLFGYDALDQLVQSAVLDGTTVLRNTTYGFDPMGNRTNVTGAAACSGDYLMEFASPPADFQMNQYTATPCDTRTYDANGNLASRVTADGALTYQFDYADRLVAVQSLGDDGTGVMTVTTVATYSYDALGRRVSKTLNPGTLAATTRQYCYDGDCVIEERENSAVAASYVSPYKVCYSVDNCLSMRLGTQDYFVHADDQGNALALTGVQGAVAERYDYDDYGAMTFLTSDGLPTSATSSAVGNPYGWGGLRLDAETGLHNDDGAGYFESSSGRSLASGFRACYTVNDNNPWSEQRACSIQTRSYLKSKFNSAAKKLHVLEPQVYKAKQGSMGKAK